MQAGIKALGDTFLGVNLAQSNPEAMNLYSTQKRQTRPAVEKCLRNNAKSSGYTHSESADGENSLTYECAGL